MPEHIQCGDCIEGQRIRVYGQDIRTMGGRPKNIQTLSGDSVLVYPLSVYRRGSGEIEAAFEDGNPRFSSTSFIQVGDTISGLHLWGFSADPPGRATPGGAGRTGSHTGQEIILEDDCSLRIVKAYNSQTLSQHPKSLLE